MPNFTAADTIRILVATDNHVGYNERDAIRGDDSWKSFHEVMCLAKERDVDMVLLAGDLFHENKPSQKSIYQVMRSLRMNCYGDKPCELEMLSDGSEAFAGAFNHVNYEDPDVNVAIPVFTIHGNHDDPSGAGHYTPLDLLQMSGLVNYYGRTPESDNILVKPILLQKGSTKLALYGLSNVRDERLFRTFRDGNVKFFQPGTQKGDWFNLMSVHQNRHAHTDTGYLPEHFLPEFLDLVVWGHEHECKIDPQYNPETTFRVMQPGSSVATSLVEGEAVAKHVAIVSVRGKDFEVENIPLKTVRPFLFREIAIQDDPTMKNVAYQEDNATKVHAHLMKVINELIDQANEEWTERQREADEEADEEGRPPLPIIRLRVDYTPPEGGNYDIENPQRFSNRFAGQVANTGDVVSYHRKRNAASVKRKNQPDMPEESIMAQLSVDNVKISKLVDEFLAAQSLSILPQNFFSDAVGQFVNKDDKTAMQDFIVQALEGQVKELVAGSADDGDEDRIDEMMAEIKEAQELAFARGQLKGKTQNRVLKPKPDIWDSDIDGHWADNPASIVREEEDDDDDFGRNEDDEDGTPAPRSGATRGGRGGRGGRGRGAKAAPTSTTRKPAAAKKAPANSTTATKGRKKQLFDDEDDDDDDDDVIMLDDDDENGSQSLFVSQKKSTTSRAAPTKAAAATTASRASKAASTTTSTRGGRSQASSTTAGRQTKLAFTGSQAQASSSGPARAVGGRSAAPRTLREPSEDEISDDDAFEPPSTAARSAPRRR